MKISDDRSVEVKLSTLYEILIMTDQPSDQPAADRQTGSEGSFTFNNNA